MIKSLLYSASNPSSGVACRQTLTPKPPSDVTPSTTTCKLQSARSLKGTEGKRPRRAAHASPPVPQTPGVWLGTVGGGGHSLDGPFVRPLTGRL